VTVPSAIAALDLNGDRRSDLYIVDKMSNKAIVLLNQGSRTLFDGTTGGTGYLSIPLQAGAVSPAVSTYDVDADGRTDLINAFEGADAVAVTITTDPLSANVNGVMAAAPRRVTFGDACTN
jgi:hypothetical protein